jgi:small multidrug resistance pump
MPYLYLVIAIIAETIGTSLLKLSVGFSKPLPSLGVALGYGISFYFLSLCLRDIPTGIAYAIWSAAGIVLITAIAWIFFGQKLDMPAILGILLIISGVLVMNIWSKSIAH